MLQTGRNLGVKCKLHGTRPTNLPPMQSLALIVKPSLAASASHHRQQQPISEHQRRHSSDHNLRPSEVRLQPQLPLVTVTCALPADAGNAVYSSIWARAWRLALLPGHAARRVPHAPVAMATNRHTDRGSARVPCPCYCLALFWPRPADHAYITLPSMYACFLLTSCMPAGFYRQGF